MKKIISVLIITFYINIVFCNTVIQAGEFVQKNSWLNNTDKEIRDKYIMCGDLSENRRFCVSKVKPLMYNEEGGQGFYYIADLNLLDEKNTLIDIYKNVLITCCDPVNFENCLPKFESGKVVLTFVRKNRENILYDNDIDQKDLTEEEISINNRSIIK